MLDLTAMDTRTFTPCFDWVVRLTGDAHAALVYGVIWRYCQLRDDHCYASQQRLAHHLGWARSTVNRHLSRLESVGLIRPVGRSVQGKPRHYIAVAADSFKGTLSPAAGQPVADCATSTPPEPVALCDTPCSDLQQLPVSDCDTKILYSKQRVDQGEGPTDPAAGSVGRARRSAPPPASPIRHQHRSGTGKGSRPQPATPAAIVAVRHLTGRYPPRPLWPTIEAAIGDQPDTALLRACYEAWLSRGYNGRSFVWLFEWYAQGGAPEDNRRPGVYANVKGTVRHDDALAPEEYARWGEFLERVQSGEDEAAVRRDLGLPPAEW
jgi:hypothetical protein